MGGSSSKSNTSKSSSTYTSTTAVDASQTVGDGLQIIDSVIVDPSDEIAMESMRQITEAFNVMTGGQTAGISEMIDLGRDLLDLIDSGQAQTADQNYNTLKTGIAALEQAAAEGRHYLDFTSRAFETTFNLAEDSIDGNNQITTKALDLVADVQGGSEADVAKSGMAMMMILALGALYFAKGGRGGQK